MTAALAALAVIAVIYAIGTERTAAAASKAGYAGKKTAKSGYTWGALGVGAGLQLGADVLMAAMMEPFAVSTIIAGVMGALGIEGVLGDISGVQFLLIGLTVFAGVVVYRKRHGVS